MNNETNNTTSDQVTHQYQTAKVETIERIGCTTVEPTEIRVVATKRMEGVVKLRYAPRAPRIETPDTK